MKLKNVSKILVLIIGGSNFSYSPADDSVWRLDTIANHKSAKYCADNNDNSGSIASALIPFGDIIYGINDSNSSYDSWFVGDLQYADDDIYLSSYASEYGDNYIPVDYAPVEISRGRQDYYPEYIEYPEQNMPVSRFEQVTPNADIVRESGTLVEAQPVFQQVVVPDNSAYGNGDKFKNKTIKYYPFR